MSIANWSLQGLDVSERASLEDADFPGACSLETVTGGCAHVSCVTVGRHRLLSGKYPIGGAETAASAGGQALTWL